MNDLAGQKFGRLTAITPLKKQRKKHIKWRCICVCGKETLVAATHLISGHTKSCGCLHREQIIKYSTAHGCCSHPLYTVWRDIIRRCEDPRRKGYKYYGGRGISICHEWRSDPKTFIEWAIVNGWRKGLTIERKNNEGNYKPENCEFITQKEQANNRRIPKNLYWFCATNDKLGIEHRHYSQRAFAKEQRLNNSHISDCLYGRQKQHKGWTFKQLIPRKECVNG